MLHGLVEARPSQHWDVGSGDRFACSPAVVGEEALTVRADGSLAAVRCYDGHPLRQAAVGGRVLSAWSTPSGLAGITASDQWSWDGKQVERSSLPATAQLGSEGALIGLDGSVWIRQATEWKNLGRMLGAPTGEPVIWAGEVAIPAGSSLQVVGPHGFTVSASADVLPPVSIGSHLVLISQDGKVRIYSP